MLSPDAARKIAEQLTEGPALDLMDVRELQHGWFFQPSDEVIGCNGLIVNKETGEVFWLGSGFSIERDLTMYDKGYQFNQYDLVILQIGDWDRALDVLIDLGISAVKPEYEHGTVWRIPYALTRNELRRRLSRLPCVFERVRLYHRLERLEEAREKDYFRFHSIGHRRPA